MARLAHGAAALVCALAASFAAGQARAEKNVLSVGMAAIDAGRLDPHLSSTTPDKALFGWMFNGLVRFKQGTMNPEMIELDRDARRQAMDLRAAQGRAVPPRLWRAHVRRHRLFVGPGRRSQAILVFQ